LVARERDEVRVGNPLDAQTKQIAYLLLIQLYNHEIFILRIHLIIYAFILLRISKISMKFSIFDIYTVPNEIKRVGVETKRRLRWTESRQ